MDPKGILRYALYGTCVPPRTYPYYTSCLITINIYALYFSRHFLFVLPTLNPE